MRQKETDFRLTKMATYTAFGDKVKATKRKLLKFLVKAEDAGRKVLCYGAAAKGVTLVNYCGVRDALVDYEVDKSPQTEPLHPWCAHPDSWAGENLRDETGLRADPPAEPKEGNQRGNADDTCSSHPPFSFWW